MIFFSFLLIIKFLKILCQTNGLRLQFKSILYALDWFSFIFCLVLCIKFPEWVFCVLSSLEAISLIVLCIFASRTFKLHLLIKALQVVLTKLSFLLLLSAVSVVKRHQLTSGQALLRSRVEFDLMRLRSFFKSFLCHEVVQSWYLMVPLPLS